MSKRAIKTYTTEVKEEAIKLATELGLTKASKELGISVSTLSGWKQKFGKYVESDSVAKNIDLEAENRRLRKELREQQMITELLKKTTAIISRDYI